MVYSSITGARVKYQLTCYKFGYDYKYSVEPLRGVGT